MDKGSNAVTMLYHNVYYISYNFILQHCRNIGALNADSRMEIRTPVTALLHPDRQRLLVIAFDQDFFICTVKITKQKEG